jgi:hypothetical protein
MDIEKILYLPNTSKKPNVAHIYIYIYTSESWITNMHDGLDTYKCISECCNMRFVYIMMGF